MRRLAMLACVALLVSQAAFPQGDKINIINSKHDFRPESTATIKAAQAPASDTQVCVYCHTPHNADPGPLLWNQELGTVNGPAYTSTTLKSTIPAMTADDSSKLCLSCHDGTIALGNTVTEGQIPFVQGAAYQLPATSRSNIAAFGSPGFTDDHPFAFTPATNIPNLKNPDAGDAVKLAAGKVQCSTCHDPHNEGADSTSQRFLVKSNQKSAICLSCHQEPAWNLSAHNVVTDPAEDAKYTSLQGAHTGYTGVANNGCESCHRPHSPETGERLIKFPEENTCFQCHDGSVTSLNLKYEFYDKNYKHPVLTTPSTHDDSENPNSAEFPLPETSASAARHSECADCHNSHSAQATPAAYVRVAPNVTPPETGASGQSNSNGYRQQAQYEYEICLKCHGDSANKPQTTDVSYSPNGVGFGRNPARQADFSGLQPNNPLPTRANVRIEFLSRPSFHPVFRPENLSTGVGGDVPSLRLYMLKGDGITDDKTRPLGPGTTIYCTDCHNNDSGRNLGTGFTAPTGPHGSNVAHILERNYEFETPNAAVQGGPNTGVPYSVSAYALCDKCHDVQNSIMKDQSFRHAAHMNDGASCATCHDSHSSNNAHLVNFDLQLVGPAQTAGTVQWMQTSKYHGTCTLSCHGHDHEGSAY